MNQMPNPKIEAHKITKPIQLMAVWFVALVIIDCALLTAAAKITTPYWIPPLLVISAICFVLIFVIIVFLMQTVFRKELQEDQFYSEMLKRQGKTFENFKAENTENKDQNDREKRSLSKEGESDLELERRRRYELQKGLFIVHTWRPSTTLGQVADIVIWLHQHGQAPLSKGYVEKVEYQLGSKFFAAPVVKTNVNEQFKLEVSAYGPMLCLARVFLKETKEPIILERYINFEEPSICDHFYTTSSTEVDTAKSKYGYRLEGIACYVAGIGMPGTIPLFRLWNRKTNDHFYTISTHERESAKEIHGYIDEDIACLVFEKQVPGTVPLYRLWNLERRNHFYTISKEERANAIEKLGYKDENVACYVFDSSKPNTTALYRMLRITK
jgi:hypothetical protein